MKLDMNKSLKNNTRAKRNKGVAVHYKVSDSTQIGHLASKQFLSSIKTNNELTMYLSEKLKDRLKIDYVIVYGRSCITNLLDLDNKLKQYSQEEADTGIVLHVIDISRRDPFTDIVVSCSDTDVLLILLYYFDEISTSIVFRAIRHDADLRFIFEQLGPQICKAILGFHAITGCDQTGKFFGISKLSCWKAFVA